jgi:hypothetical protein
MNTKMKLVLSVVLLCLPVGLYADAGFVALEGSDATALHHDASYTPQLFSYLQGSSSLPVLVYNPAGVIDLSGIDGGVGLVNKTSLTGLTLSDYSAIYIESPGGCCQADNTVLNGHGADVLAFIAAGGNLSIENYVGGGYDGVVVGGAAAPAGSIQGFGVSNGGVGGGPSCTDGERVTAFGMSKGFAQPPIDGCWSHQAYETSYWGPLGYQSIMASATDATSGGFGFTFADKTQDGSSFLALGGTLGGTGGPPPVPEPSTVVLLGGALAVLVAGKKRFASR